MQHRTHTNHKGILGGCLLSFTLVLGGCASQAREGADIPPPPRFIEYIPASAEPAMPTAPAVPMSAVATQTTMAATPSDSAMPDLSQPSPPAVLQAQASTPSEDDAEKTLDWSGTYQAILPCKECIGVAVSVQLRQNKTAMVRERMMGSEHATPLITTYNGAFDFDQNLPHILTLRHSNKDQALYHFLIGENWIELRDPVTAAPLDPRTAFRLYKSSVSHKTP